MIKTNSIKQQRTDEIGSTYPNPVVKANKYVVLTPNDQRSKLIKKLKIF